MVAVAVATATAEGRPAPACLSSWSNASATIPGRSGRRVVRRPGRRPGTAGAGGRESCCCRGLPAPTQLTPQLALASASSLSPRPPASPAVAFLSSPFRGIFLRGDTERGEGFRGPILAAPGAWTVGPGILTPGQSLNVAQPQLEI